MVSSEEDGVASSSHREMEGLHRVRTSVCCRLWPAFHSISQEVANLKQALHEKDRLIALLRSQVAVGHLQSDTHPLARLTFALRVYAS